MSFVRNTLSSMAAGAILTLGAAHAEEPVSAKTITEALKPKPLTRSLAGPTGMSVEQTQFVDQLRRKTRAITVVERKKLAAIVADGDLPAIDLEILFDYNSSAITRDAMPHLLQLSLALRDDALRNSTFLLGGHTDAMGDDAYNQRLSEERAQSAKDFLVKNFNIDSYQLIAVGYGEEQLKNSADPNAAENRRVQIVNVTR